MIRKTGTIAWHEFVSTLKRRSALFAIFGLPVITLLILSGINWLVRTQSQTNLLAEFAIGNNSDQKPAGLVDETMRVTTFSSPADTVFVQFKTLEAAQIAFDDGEIDMIYRIPEDYLTTGNIYFYASNVDLDGSEEGVLFGLLAENFLANDLPISRIVSPIAQLDEIDLSATESQTGQGLGANIGLILGIAILFYITVIGASGYLLQSLGVEKQSRVMEILLSSVRPLQLLVGKVIGLGGIGLLQMTVWTVLVLVVFQRSNSIFSNLPLPSLPAEMWIITILHFTAGYFVYASIFAGLGAIAPNVKEGSQYTFFLMLPTLLPMWFNTIMITAPNGTFASILSFFPLTAALAMPMRLALTSVPIWQWLLSLSLSIGLAVFLLWGSAKLFRSQVLLSGQSLSPGIIWQALKGA